MPRFTEQLRQVLIRYSRLGSTDITQQEIADELDRNRATVHEHCQRLWRLGYLRRVEHGRYEITDSGRAVLERRPATACRTMRCPNCNHRIIL